MTHQQHGDHLVERAKRGDRAALEQLFSDQRSRLLARVQSRLSDQLRKRVDAEDILQDTLCRAFEMIDRFQWRGEGSFLAWIAAIAEHLILNATKKKQLETIQLDRDASHGGASPATVLSREERYERLKASLRTLTSDQRNAILLARIDGLAAREIAARMERSEQAVRQLLTRALRELKDSFEDTGSLHLPDRNLLAEDLSGD